MARSVCHLVDWLSDNGDAAGAGNYGEYRSTFGQEIGV